MARYTTRLKLEFDPFEPKAPARGFFPGAGRGELLDTLLEDMLTSGALACVTGELGSGKSTLAEELRRRCGDDAECAVVQATLFMNRGGFLDNLAVELPWLDAAGNWQGSLDLIASRAAELDLDARAIVIVIDDAHELSSEVVGVMAQILKRCNSGLSLLLLGERQLPALLQNALPAALLDRAGWYELYPFSSEDGFDYVRFKLAAAGYTRSLPLPGGKIGSLYNQSGGNPARLNALVASALEDSDMAPSPESAPVASVSLLDQSWPYWMAAAVLVAVLLGVVFVGDGGGNDGAAGVARQSIPLPIPAPEPVVTTAPEEDLAAVSSPPEEATVATASSPQQGGLASVPGQAVPEQVDGTPKPDGSDPVAPDRMSTPATTDRPTPDPATRGGESGSVSAFTDSLLAAAPSHFTIQVMGTRSRDSAQRFLTLHFPPDRAGIVETRYQDQPWYVVIHGNYADSDSARAAIEGLPAAVRELQPFVRSLADIQAAARQQLSSR